ESSLPDLQFEDATIVESRMELFRDPGVMIDLPAGATADRIDDAADIPKIAAPDDVPLGYFSRTEAGNALRFRVFVNERPRIDTLASIDAPAETSSSAAEFEVALRFPAPAAGSAPYRVRIPQVLAG